MLSKLKNMSSKKSLKENTRSTDKKIIESYFTTREQSSPQKYLEGDDEVKRL